MKVTEFMKTLSLPSRSPDMGCRAMKNTLQGPSFRAALRFWCKLGWISFGGTAAHIAIMHDELVQKKRWISNRSFLHALSHCMILPGPEAQQLSIYIGWKLHGKRGGIVAGTLFVLPSMFILLALSVVYVSFGNLPWIAAILDGLKPVVIALVIVALQRVARRAVRGPIQGAVAVATFVAMFFFEASLLAVMLSAIALGIALTAVWPGLLHPPAKAGAEADDERYYIRRSSAATKPIPLLWPLMKLAVVVLFLWLLPLPLFYLFVGDFHFWRDLSLFLHQNRLRDDWRLIYGNSLCSPGRGVEISLADQAPNDGRLRTRRDNARPTDHSSSLCRVPGRVQPLPRLIVDGNLGFAGNDLLFVPAVFFLRICGCAAGGTNSRQPYDWRPPGTDHRCRGRRDLGSNAIPRESGDLPIRSYRSQATQCDLFERGDIVAPPALSIQTEGDSPDSTGHWVRFYSLFPGFLTAIPRNSQKVS
jgi:chromate transport protein ChrA